MRGILLAGGSGTRLHPMTKAVSKHLLPIYDKPLIYYSLSTLMRQGIHEIMLITTPEDAPQFYRLLGSGEQWGISLQYAEQCAPRGIADAILIGQQFIGRDHVCLALGDNIFYGNSLHPVPRDGATICAYEVQDPSRYGVIEFDDKGRPISLEEKPACPKSNYAVPGLYFYPPDCVEIAKELKPSARGELELTDLNKIYLRQARLYAVKLGRGVAWLDAGTPAAMLEAANFVATIQTRQGLKVCDPAEIAKAKGWI